MTDPGYCECGCGQETVVVKWSNRSMGWIKGQPKRFIHGHNRRLRGPKWIEEDRGYKTPCRIWTRAKNQWGYGVLRVGYRTTRLAHRVIYAYVHGPIPAGMEIDHLCRNRACVRLEHLEAVTKSENLRREREANGWATS